MRLRTCLGCGVKVSKLKLVRFVWLNDMLDIDPEYVKKGRGVYCCRSQECFQKLLKNKKKLIKGLRWPDNCWIFEKH